jgi:hypothetical protein
MPVTVSFAIIMCSLGLLGLFMVGMIVAVLYEEHKWHRKRPDYDDL